MKSNTDTDDVNIFGLRRKQKRKKNLCSFIFIVLSIVAIILSYISFDIAFTFWFVLIFITYIIDEFIL